MRRGFLLALLALVACRAPQTGPVRLDRGATFNLRPVGSGPAFFASQQVVFTQADGTEETFLTTVEHTPERLSLVASTPFGQTLFTVQMDAQGTRIDPRLPLPAWLDLRLLPTLVQLANWPLEEVRRGLGKGLALQETGSDRTLLKGTEVLLRLHREGDTAPYRAVELEIPRQKVRVRITTLEDTP